MKQRVITGAVYVALCVALLAMKWTFYLLPAQYAEYGALGFDVMFELVAIIGCIEFMRALGVSSAPQKILTVAFCAAVIPVYVAVEMTMGEGFFAAACFFCIYVLILAAFAVFDHSRSTARGAFTCVGGMLYCGILPCVLSGINHIESNSVIAILLLFVVSMMTDSGAFFVGKLFKNIFPKKLAPHLSPGKTVVGAIGGLLGGIAGAVISYYLFVWIGGYIGTPVVYEADMPAVVAFMIVGLIVSVAVQIGDLFESAIKRECEIKDMGKILPGHGGVLDRFDGVLFGGVFTFILFSVVINVI